MLSSLLNEDEASWSWNFINDIVFSVWVKLFKLHVNYSLLCRQSIYIVINIYLVRSYELFIAVNFFRWDFSIIKAKFLIKNKLLLTVYWIQEGKREGEYDIFTYFHLVCNFIIVIPQSSSALVLCLHTVLPSRQT